MPKTVWKFAVPITGSGRYIRELPRGAQPLYVGVQNGAPWLWVLLDPGEPPETHTFVLYGTGHMILNAGAYIGSFMLLDDTLVYHLFEEP